MHHPLPPLLLLVLAPLAGAAWGLGLCARRGVRWLLIGGAALALGAGVAVGGVDFTALNHMKLWVALAVVVILALRRAGLAGFESPRVYRAALAAVALPAWLIYFNFCSFHGTGSTRVFVHLHDVAHYYLGSKYFREVGYADLYTAMLRAEAERYDNHFMAVEARDLRSNALMHIRALLADSDAVKGQFTPARWAAFQDDVAYFRDAMRAQYGEVLRDHGFNPTPVWALLGGTLANLVPAGSHRGIVLLTLLDPLIEAALFAAIGWAFGTEVLLLSLIYFCLPFGASFGWTGGSFLRHMWLAGVLGAACCLERGRHGMAGVLLALATCLRVFPFVFAAGLACKAGLGLWRERRLSAAHARFFLAFVLTGLLLGAGTALLPRGLQHWAEFRTNMERHVATEATNIVGLTQILAYTGTEFPTTVEESDRRAARRQTIYHLQLALAVPLLGLLVAFSSARARDADTLALGLVLLFATLNLASYYYACLLLLLLTHRARARHLALLFAGEAAIYALGLFEDREVVLFLYRSLLIAYLLAALHFDGFRTAARDIRRLFRPQPA